MLFGQNALRFLKKPVCKVGEGIYWWHVQFAQLVKSANRAQNFYDPSISTAANAVAISAPL
jgi:hypothetical protein